MTDFDRTITDKIRFSTRMIICFILIKLEQIVKFYFIFFTRNRKFPWAFCPFAAMGVLPQHDLILKFPNKIANNFCLKIIFMQF